MIINHFVITGRERSGSNKIHCTLHKELLGDIFRNKDVDY